MSSSRKYPQSPHRRDWNFLAWVGRFFETKKFKKCMELNWNCQRGGEVLRKIPSVGRNGYFLELYNPLDFLFWSLYV